MGTWPDHDNLQLPELSKVRDGWPGPGLSTRGLGKEMVGVQVKATHIQILGLTSDI